MTIQEAVKSGKRFRRPGNPYLEYDEDGNIVWASPNNMLTPVAPLYAEDLMASDWEVQNVSHILDVVEWKRAKLENGWPVFYPVVVRSSREFTFGSLLSVKTKLTIEII
jgi:hypothetical protein